MIESDEDKLIRIQKEIAELRELLAEVNEERLYCAVNACKLKTQLTKIQKEEAAKGNKIH